MGELGANQKVELAPAYAHLYNPEVGRMMGAFVGARATVRDRREDDAGFPHIFIEWEKDDWRYAGMPDGWTFENHFRPIEEPVAKTPSDLIIDLINQQEEKRCPHCGDIHDSFEEVINAYVDEVERAQEAAFESDGFIVLTIKQEPGSPNIFTSEMFNAQMSPTAREALERQIIELASELVLQRRRS